MRITTKLKGVTREGVKIHVNIHKEQPEKVEGIPDILDEVFNDVYMTMEIVGILNALKDCNENAFNKAMERFIEEELAQAEEDNDNE